MNLTDYDLIPLEIASNRSWESQPPQLPAREEDEKIWSPPLLPWRLIPFLLRTPCCFSHFRNTQNGRRAVDCVQIADRIESTVVIVKCSSKLESAGLLKVAQA